MILIITGIYCGIIWLVFFKLKLLPWNSKSRNGAIAVGVVLLTGILIALFQGSPGSTLPISIQSRVVQISSGVSGRVVKLHVEGNMPVKKGDPLFQIDPVPYQNEVNRLTAQLAQAESGVVQMQETRAAAKASVVDIQARLTLAQGVASRVEGDVQATIDAAEASVVSATESLGLAKLDWERNDAQVKVMIETAEANLRAQGSLVRQAELEEKRSKTLLEKHTVSQNDYDIRVRNLETSQAQEEALTDVLEQTRLSGSQQTDTRRTALATAKASLITSESQLTSARLSGTDRIQKAKTDVESLTAQLASTQAQVKQAEAWLAPTVDGEHVTVRQVRDALGTAKFNLWQTTTYAPSDGFATSLALAEGSFVRVMPVMSFVSTELMFAAAPIAQNTARHIKPGDTAELSIRTYPGTIITGTVIDVVYATGEAEVKPGSIARADQPLASRNVFVRILADDPDHPLHFGMTGSAAIYTDTASAFAVVRKVMIRMDALLNFLF